MTQSNERLNPFTFTPDEVALGSWPNLYCFCDDIYVIISAIHIYYGVSNKIVCFARFSFKTKILIFRLQYTATAKTLHNMHWFETVIVGVCFQCRQFRSGFDVNFIACWFLDEAVLNSVHVFFFIICMLQSKNLFRSAHIRIAFFISFHVICHRSPYFSKRHNTQSSWKSAERCAGIRGESMAKQMKNKKTIRVRSNERKTQQRQKKEKKKNMSSLLNIVLRYRSVEIVLCIYQYVMHDTGNKCWHRKIGIMNPDTMNIFPIALTHIS